MVTRTEYQKPIYTPQNMKQINQTGIWMRQQTLNAYTDLCLVNGYASQKFIKESDQLETKFSSICTLENVPF